MSIILSRNALEKSLANERLRELKEIFYSDEMIKIAKEEGRLNEAEDQIRNTLIRVISQKLIQSDYETLRKVLAYILESGQTNQPLSLDFVAKSGRKKTSLFGLMSVYVPVRLKLEKELKLTGDGGAISLVAESLSMSEKSVEKKYYEAKKMLKKGGFEP